MASRPSAPCFPISGPSDAPSVRVRVVLAALLLVAAKVATVYIPIVYSHAVDALAPQEPHPDGPVRA